MIDDLEKTTVFRTNLDDDKTIKFRKNDQTVIFSNGTNHQKKIIGEIDPGNIIDGYVVGNLINLSGGEADIRFCYKNGKTYVLKVFRRDMNMTDSIQDKISKIDSIHVMKVIKQGIFNNRFYQILPYYQNGSLNDNLEKIDNHFIINIVIPSINEGLKKIHEADLCHNDIKPSNIFVTDDFNSVVIGDFGIAIEKEGRTSVTNVEGRGTAFYLAPEASEVSNMKTDYYSFGQTLKTLTLKKNPFQGISAKRTRREIIQNKQYIPEDIPSDIADLIFMLTKYDPSTRITYSGVQKWIDNNEIYNGDRRFFQQNTVDEKYKIDQYDFEINGKFQRFNNLIDLSQAMLENWDIAIKHYEAGLFTQKIKNFNQPLYLEIKDIEKNNINNSSLALFLILIKINPKLEFIYKNIKIKNFEDLILYYADNYTTGIDSDFYNKDFLKLIKEKIYFKEEIKILFEKVINSAKGFEIVDLLLNTFKSTKKFYYRKKIFNNINECLKIYLFDDKFNPVDFKLGTNKKLFFDIILKPFSVDEETIKEISSYKFILSENIKLSKILIGSLSLKLYNYEIKNLKDFLDIIKIYKEQKQTILKPNIENMLKSEIFKYLVNKESNKEKILKLITNNSEQTISNLYFLIGEQKPYMNCKNLAELSKKISKENKLNNISSQIINDYDFKTWLLSQGIQYKRGGK